MNRRRIPPAARALLIGCLAFPGGVIAEQAEWKPEFERICIQVETSEGLSAGQLQVLIEDSEALLERLAEVEDPGAKIYVPRLEKCRDFFSFMRAVREQEEAQTDPGG